MQKLCQSLMPGQKIPHTQNTNKKHAANVQVQSISPQYTLHPPNCKAAFSAIMSFSNKPYTADPEPDMEL